MAGRRVSPRAPEPSSSRRLTRSTWERFLPSRRPPAQPLFPWPPSQVQPPPLPSASPCLSVSPGPLFRTPCPSVPLSVFLPLSHLVSLNLSPSLEVPFLWSQGNSLSQPRPPTPAIIPHLLPLPQLLRGGPCPKEPPSLTPGGHAHPAAQRQAPDQRDPAHPGAPPRHGCQTFLRSCWAPSRGGGRAGLSPALPPAPGSLDLALTACLAQRQGRPSPPPTLLSSRPLSTPASFSHSQTWANPFSTPGSPFASAHQGQSPGATWTVRG